MQISLTYFTPCLSEKIGGHKTFRTDMCVGAEHKQEKKDNIREIQTAYRAKGIRVSFKLHGGGTTNDGKLMFNLFPQESQF